MQTKAYAKLNLALSVTGQRPDGYHLLDSIFCQIDLCDTLDIEQTKCEGLNFSCSDPMLRTADNLVVKAARLFSEKSGTPLALRIHLEKHIPLQAGLGGGSADAAAVLLTLQSLYPNRLNDSALLESGLDLGADVPFALGGGLQRAQGIGEILTPITHQRQLHFVVMKPKAGLSTPTVFKAYDTSPSYATPDIERAIEDLQTGDFLSFAAHARNVLQPCAQSLCPEIEPLCEALRQNGAIYTSMTGTGSAVFGLFENENEAKLAQAVLMGRAPLCVYASTLLLRPPTTC